jgi:hypothetical protein
MDMKGEKPPAERGFHGILQLSGELWLYQMQGKLAEFSVCEQ